MTKARFQLTRRAALDLRDIHEYSRTQWGEKAARSYIDSLYAAMGKLNVDAAKGKRRESRAMPFSSFPHG
jgi:plasmid stabilization system protein ParE